MTRLIAVVLLSALLTACSSNPVEQVNYYLLDNATASGEIKGPAPDAQTVLLKDIQLADYLSHMGLAMQLQDHQLYFSRQHAWAEKLQEGLYKAIQNDINASGGGWHILSQSAPSVKPVEYELLIKFDHFVATSGASVIASGTYWIVTTSDTPQMVEKRFSLQETLLEDGFPHAVSQLRRLVKTLSQRIEQDLQSMSG